MAIENAKAQVNVGASIESRQGISESVGVHTIYNIECISPDGTLKWKDTFKNLVVNVGLDDLLDKRFKASAYTSSDFVGLTDGTPTIAASDTMASHAGWVEVEDYDEATREALTLGSISSQSVDNVGNLASFTMNATVTIGGAFITTVNTKGGTLGILYSVGAFAGGDKSADDNDILNVTATLTIAAT